MNLKGVNLGGWLVLERWITPSLFDGLEAKDETSFCLELGEAKHNRLKKHRSSFITEEDFEWIASNGLNSIRIPAPHWVFGDIEPYVGCIERLDWAMDMAKKYDLKVLVDIHTAPGSQNGWDHSGLVGKINWHKDPANIETSLEVIKKIAARYGNYPSLWGIELLNEPNWNIPKDLLLDFYKQGYERVRKYCDEPVAVIISDTFKPLAWHGAMTEPEFKSVVTDTHLYQCFSWQDKRLSLQGHLRKTEGEWATLIEKMRSRKPVIIGEWSLGLPPKAFEELDEKGKKEALRSFGESQLNVFGKTAGWLFWTYKTESSDAWNFRWCVESGLLPEKF